VEAKSSSSIVGDFQSALEESLEGLRGWGDADLSFMNWFLVAGQRF
jgi:hypothetical protein